MEEVRRAYGAVADQYVKLFGTRAEVHADDVALISRRLAIRAGIVVDVGCGPGHLTDHLRSLQVEALGIDVTPEFIEHARVTYPEGRYVVASLCELPMPAQSVAGILAWYSLIHVPPHDLDAVLAEVRRTMIPSGTLVVGFFDGDEVAAFEHKVVTAHFWPVDEMSQRLQRAGFTVVERLRRPGSAEARSHAAVAAVVAEK